MDQNEEKILRKYLKRRIAEKNLLFARMTHSFIEEAKSMRYVMFNSFARFMSIGDFKTIKCLPAVYGIISL